MESSSSRLFSKFVGRETIAVLFAILLKPVSASCLPFACQKINDTINTRTEDNIHLPANVVQEVKQGNILQLLRTRLPSLRLRSHPLRVILLMALLNGLIYILLIPPWWHYDEPGHFEYAWLIANRSTWPKPGEKDEAMRREMARSMQGDGWYKLRNYTPDFSSNKPIWIGAPQIGGQPAYYFVVASFCA